MVTKFRRYWQIADILFNYQFGVIVHKLFPGVHRFRRGKPPKVDTAANEYARMRMAIEELGPTFIKFGQIMSTRQEMLPPGLIEELKTLQDHVNPLPFEDIEKVVYMGCPEKGFCFANIDHEPLASASISQVHKARLPDGTPVVLKVQRPGIKDIIETDILILESFAQRAEAVFPEWRVYNPRGIIADFTSQIRKELDFVRDGRNADRLRKNMRKIPDVKVPRIYWEYSGPHLLVMEYIEGVRVDDIASIREFGVNPKKIAEDGFYVYMKQIFEDGFFHGDPHPGNLLVTSEGILAFLDFGIVGIIRPERRFWFIGLINAMIEEDPVMLLKALEGLGVVIPEEHRESLRDDIYSAMLDSGGSQIGEYSFSGMANGLTAILRKYQIRVPMNLMLMLKVIIMVMDVGLALDPEFDFTENSERFMEGLSRRESMFDYLFRRGAGSLVEAVDGFFDMPRNLNRMLKQFSTGTVKIDIIDTDIRRLQQALDRTSNKIVVALIIAAMVVGSSFILRESSIYLPELVVLVATLTYVAAIGMGFYALYHVIFGRNEEKK
ncbi:MAG TPA: AarF/UbiB family protein [Methanoregulaceae archaeon]|nr:AarF/UbiB family protein [Methanoregulaceae archaeon]